MTAETPVPTFSKRLFSDFLQIPLAILPCACIPRNMGHVSKANAQFALMMQEVERASRSPSYLITFMGLILCHSSHFIFILKTNSKMLKVSI